MNKSNKSKCLVIVLGEIITLISICLYLIKVNYILNNINDYLYEMKNIILTDKKIYLIILGLLLIIIGVNLDKNDEKLKNYKIKYNFLKMIGFLPFLGMIYFGILYIFKGYQFYTNGINDIYIYGLKALITTITTMIILLWPLYIIGIILIIISSIKLKKIEKK